MSTKRIVGIGLLVIGLGLLFFGLQATDTLTEELHETVTGRYTDETIWYLIGGAAAAVVGLLLTLFGGKR
jgi:Na+/phosphate symporter